MAHAMIRIEESVTGILYEQWDNSILSQSSKAHSIASASSRDDMKRICNKALPGVPGGSGVVGTEKVQSLDLSVLAFVRTLKPFVGGQLGDAQRPYESLEEHPKL